MSEITVNIGGASGMWGDSYLSTPQLLADGRCDYLIYEGLAEITMAILTKARMKDAAHGYAHDLVTTIGTNLRQMRDSGVKVITNAGGINPEQQPSGYVRSPRRRASTSASRPSLVTT